MTDGQGPHPLALLGREPGRDERLDPAIRRGNGQGTVAGADQVRGVDVDDRQNTSGPTSVIHFSCRRVTRPLLDLASAYPRG
jgi:hypothetical protein